MDMEAKLLILASHVLKYARDRMVSAGCNDTPREWLQHFSDAELVQLHSDYGVYNGEEERDRTRPLGDFQYASYLGHLFYKAAIEEGENALEATK